MVDRYWPLLKGSVVTSGFGAREGGFHYGVDFGGAKGPLPGTPVYAIQSGTVLYNGAASGYGGPDPAGWLVIDSSDAQGSGVFEYGHIVRENWVRPGATVQAGQRIGVINPNRQTNAGVTPHLHVSYMPREYNPNSKIDFRHLLKGCKYAGEPAPPAPRPAPTPQPPKDTPMTAADNVVEQLRGPGEKGWDGLAPQPDNNGNRFSQFLKKNVVRQTVVEALGTVIFELTVRIKPGERGYNYYKSQKGDTVAGNAANAAAISAEVLEELRALRSEVQELKNK